MFKVFRGGECWKTGHDSPVGTLRWQAAQGRCDGRSLPPAEGEAKDPTPSLLITLESRTPSWYQLMMKMPPRRLLTCTRRRTLRR
jgi:hypothetical protein